MIRLSTRAILGTVVGLSAIQLLFSFQEQGFAEDQLFIAANKTTLGIGESAQLTVTVRHPDLRVVDVTDTSTGTEYFTTDESMLVPENDGRITCIGTQGNTTEQAIVSARHGRARASIEVHLTADGPGPTLDIIPEKVVLYEGEKVHFQVLKHKDKTDLTSRASGTQYIAFAGDGTPDSDVIHIDDDKSTLSAMKSLGKFQQLHPIMFVRNGDLVGWLALRIVRKNNVGGYPAP